MKRSSNGFARSSARLLGALWLALPLAGCTAMGVPLPTPSTPPAAAAPASANLEEQIAQRVNQHRASRGLAPLTYDPRIADLARAHSQEMASGAASFGHAGFEQRVSAIGGFLSVAGAAENVAVDPRAGPSLADLVVQGWLGSAGHRENIEGSYDRTGVGAARAADGRYYFTQIFIRTAH